MDFFALIEQVCTAGGLIPWWGIFVIAGGSFLAGFVDSIAGGGGLISFPSLMVTGLPLHAVIGTTKLASTMGTAVATIKYARYGYMVAWLCAPCAVCALIGSCLGAHLSLCATEDFLRIFMLVVLPFAGFYVLKKNDFETHDAAWSKARTCASCTACAFVIGIYDGFYGPGTGTFLMLVLTSLGGLGINHAQGLTKCINLTTNISALVVFLLNNTCLISLGIIGGVFNMAGNYVGSKQFSEKGSALVRPLMLVVLVLFALRLISELVA